MKSDLASVYTDFQGIQRLKSEARQDAGKALDEVAHQFESLLLNQMLKSMRQASLGEGLMDNDQSRFYRDMYDQQLAIHLVKDRGIGLAEVIKRQLGGQLPQRTEAEGAGAPGVSSGGRLRRAPTTASPPGTAVFSSPQDFLHRLRPLAERAGRALGLPADALLAQAALETGWGRRVIRLPDGRSSHNLFNIKAGSEWTGARAAHETLEYEGGVRVRRREDFRAYDSYAASFEDYVRFLQSNPRYREALEATAEPAGYFRRLQKAGYATDPAYAEKVGDILERIRTRRS